MHRQLVIGLELDGRLLLGEVALGEHRFAVVDEELDGAGIDENLQLQRIAPLYGAETLGVIAFVGTIQNQLPESLSYESEISRPDSVFSMTSKRCPCQFASSPSTSNSTC